MMSEEIVNPKVSCIAGHIKNLLYLKLQMRSEQNQFEVTLVLHYVSSNSRVCVFISSSVHLITGLQEKPQTTHKH